MGVMYYTNIFGTYFVGAPCSKKCDVDHTFCVKYFIAVTAYLVYHCLQNRHRSSVIQATDHAICTSFLSFEVSPGGRNLRMHATGPESLARNQSMSDSRVRQYPSSGFLQDTGG